MWTSASPHQPGQPVSIFLINGDTGEIESSVDAMDVPLDNLNRALYGAATDEEGNAWMVHFRGENHVGKKLVRIDIDDLAKKGVTDEELSRLREPILKKRRDAKRTNGYWLAGIGRAQSDPGRLDYMRTGDDFYENVTAADLSKLATQYLSRERASIAVVSPAK